MTNTQTGSDGNTPKECDLVMKGGITSGIIYPPLVIRLHEDGYSFRNVGGTSAGAIAAAVTAAAEHGKDTGGFEKLNLVREWLGSDGNLLRLFRPGRKTAALMNTLLCYARLKWLRWVPLRALVAALRYDALVFAMGAVVGGGVSFLFAWLVGGSLAGRGWVVTFIFALVCGALAVAWHLMRILSKTVPANGFGLCTGRGERVGALDKTVLTDWLHVRINDMAGKGTGRHDAPLTFRDLWGADAPGPGDKRIDLRMMTSNLSQNQPYVLPFVKSTFIFKRAEMKRLFPPSVVEHMVEKSRPCEGIILPEGYFFLPEAKELPVVFATRMSLSFPVLISMIPLYTISQKAFNGSVRCQIEAAPDPARPDTTREVVVFMGRDEAERWHTCMGDERQRIKPRDLQRNWFSDGGICSNFPIHFFDAWLPTRPTFGVNLTSQLAEAAPGEEIADKIKERSSVVAQQTEFGSGTDSADPMCYSKDVYLPRPDETIPPQWMPLEGLGQFLESVFRTAQNYRDNMQAMLPSYRERIVQIRLTDEEGGLNLNMDTETIDDIVKKGYEAGDKLIRYFKLEQHQWVRFRVLMKQMEASLDKMNTVMRDCEFYMKTVANPPLPKDFPYQRSDQWCRDAQRQLEQIGRVVQELAPPDLFAEKPFPLPEPVLRVMPEI
ncbi:MAG: hypothetical protein QOJ70_2456 [Acidobacteriota bacterium]|nr:hypothetical protein [Acidobacteriota bacterium]